MIFHATAMYNILVRSNVSVIVLKEEKKKARAKVNTLLQNVDAL